MPKPARPTPSRTADAILALVALVLGAVAACGYGAWRAVSSDAATTADRWSTFGDAMLFPGLLVIVAVAAMVWLGWKANID
ncbi:MAG: hypothetical protein EPO22_14565 [Dehalococcoidia bacterium]|nr:MAG: hypothetical protein EPO22_14565 [Dehalococcoidia bacterium]